MARTAIPIASIIARVANSITAAGWATADAANDYEWLMVPGDVLLVTNLAASAPTYTIVRPENLYGRGDDYTSGTIAQNSVVAHRFWTVDGWSQADGTVQIDTTSNDLRFVVLRPRPSL